jgi:hypothetical protein
MRTLRSFELALTGVVVMCATFSVVRAVVQHRAPIEYDGTRGVAGPLRAPRSEGEVWLSADVEAPPRDADRAALLAWLRQHYPAMSIGVPTEGRAHETEGIDLGGGPPRDVWVLPGRGLVLREQKAP